MATYSVCSLEQANKLKELGVTQVGTSMFYKEYPDLGEAASKPNSSDTGFFPCVFGRSFNRAYGLNVNECAAYETSDLGRLIDWNHVSVCPPYKDSKLWVLCTNEIDFSNEHEATVRADVLIYQLENNLTTADEANQRLNGDAFDERDKVKIQEHIDSQKFHATIVGFQHKDVEYRRCKDCPDGIERFTSVAQHLVDGKMNYRFFNGVKWALDNGYEPIFK